VKKTAVLALSAFLAVSPARGESRYFDFASDFLQALHLCYWAADLQVDGRRPLVTLVLSLDEQRQKLNLAREILLTHEAQPSPDGRRAVEALLNGIELFSLIASDDMDDIDAMNYRSELAQRMDGRADARFQAVAVMAGSVRYLRDSVLERKGSAKGAKPMPFHVTEEEAASLWKQATLFFGEDLAVGGGGRTSPILMEIEELRRALRRLSELPAEKSP
jgi:hypothetical protein